MTSKLKNNTQKTKTLEIVKTMNLLNFIKFKKKNILKLY